MLWFLMNFGGPYMPTRLIIATLICGLLAACVSAADIDAMREEAALEKSLMNIARASQESRDYVAAVRYYHQIHERKPTNINATLGLARNLRYAGLPKRAIQVLEEALANGLENSHLLAELARALIAGGEAERAIGPLTEALTSGPKDWRTLSTLGVANDQLGRHDVARNAYSAALVLSPENVAVLNNLALSWALDGNIEQGISVLERAASLPGATAQTRQNLALLHGLSGNLGKAQDLARLDLPEVEADENLRYYVALKTGVVEAEGGSGVTIDVPSAYAIQLGSYATAKAALDSWQALRLANPRLLGSLKIEFLSGKTGDSESFIARAGPLASQKDADELCRTLSARGAGCRVVKR
jgi:Flp pilus assembly protein TadD